LASVGLVVFFPYEPDTHMGLPYIWCWSTSKNPKRGISLISKFQTSIVGPCWGGRIFKLRLCGCMGLKLVRVMKFWFSPSSALGSDNSVGYCPTTLSVGHCILLKEGGETSNTFPIDDTTNHVRPKISGLKTVCWWWNWKIVPSSSISHLVFSYHDQSTGL